MSPALHAECSDSAKVMPERVTALRKLLPGAAEPTAVHVFLEVPTRKETGEAQIAFALLNSRLPYLACTPD